MTLERKQIPGYSRYEASNDGKIYQIRRQRKGSDRFRNINRELQIRFNTSNYHTVGVTPDDGKHHYRPVHRLIAMAFLDNPENKPIVNHIDMNKHNNLPSNLEWCTYKENTQHAMNLQEWWGPKGENHGSSYFSTEEVVEIIRDILDYKTNSYIAEKHAVCPKLISIIRQQKRWKSVWSEYFPGQKTPESVYITNKHSIADQVKIIELIQSGEHTLKHIAEMHDINRSVISRVKNKHVWNAAWEKYNLTKCPTTIESSTEQVE